MNLAVIPARGGSKRIPRKNVKVFAGKPMIAYAIEAARACAEIERVIVSTDDDEIMKIANDLGAETPFRRPAELSDDHTPTLPVIAHAVKACQASGCLIDNVCCIYPAVPLIDPADLSRSLALLMKRGSGFVFPVAAFPSAIQRALRLASTGAVDPFDPAHVGTRTQDLEPAYFDAGQFYWGAARDWLGGRAIHANASAIVLPEWRVADIDNPDDWERAERIFKASRSFASA